MSEFFGHKFDYILTQKQIIDEKNDALILRTLYRLSNSQSPRLKDIVIPNASKYIEELVKEDEADASTNSSS